MDEFRNVNLTDIETSIDPDVLESLLKESKYDEKEMQFLVHGFRHGFDLEYRGSTHRQSHAKNIPFSVGDKVVLWNKLMKEVKLNRVAGPFEEIPFQNYIQSPIGLVLKAGSDQTRLIFHLSYRFGDGEEDHSVNECIPAELCSVTYNDLDHAVKSILVLQREGLQWFNKQNHRNSRDEGVVVIYFGKSDIKSAFRVVPLSQKLRAWLIMLAYHPITGKPMFFVDKCLPFGASISCALFQRISNAIKHIVQFKTGSPLTNYLDDFLFFTLTVLRCNQLLSQFLHICKQVGFPIAEDKTEWASELITFLGILLDGRHFVLSLPVEKQQKAIGLLQEFMDRSKVKVRELQKLCEYLNFICRAIYPGRVFTRWRYAKYSKIINPNRCKTQQPTSKVEPGKMYKFKQHYHVRLDAEFKLDCGIWLQFLQGDLRTVVNRPMIDLDDQVHAREIGFSSDASAAVTLGFGSIYKNRWIQGEWGVNFMKQFEPSIEYLELFALCAGILTWAEELSNCRIIVRCDNQAVVAMVNNITSSCPNCMHLLCILVLNGLKHNRRVMVTYIDTKSNYLSDSLSRSDFKQFRKLGPHMNLYPDKIAQEIWPIDKIWKNLTK